MSLIYMQSTIDNMLTNYQDKMNDLNSLGEPEPVELIDDKGNVLNKYYIFK
jgi:hypothetical protein